MDGFVNATHRLLTAAWGVNWGVFSEEEPTGNDPESITVPHVTFELTEREIAKELPQFRARTMKTLIDPDYPEFYIEVKQRFFCCRVSFRVWHKTNQAARSVTEKMEYFLENFTGYFKEHGIMQMKFVKEGKPEVKNESRQLVPKRELVYDIYLVQTDIIRTKLLQDVLIKLQDIETEPGAISNGLSLS